MDNVIDVIELLEDILNEFKDKQQILISRDRLEEMVILLKERNRYV